MRNVIISPEELRPFGKVDSLADITKTLLNQQKTSWELLRKNYDALNNVEIKTFNFDNFEIKVQFNPGRITSSTAKVDEASIKARKCFLCVENLPEAQRGIPFNKNYLILANPYPIFREHFTIPSLEHRPQFLLSAVEDFLSLSKELGEYYVVFYNGPKSGASAPDHLHFQAGEKEFLPLYKEIENLKGKIFFEYFNDDDFQVFYSQNYLRNLILIESGDAQKIKKAIESILNLLNVFTHQTEEPMINVLSFFEKGKWKIVLIPREKHRPDYYFKEGKEQILFSPASVDLGGVCITPREEDFHKMSKEILIDALKQVTIPQDKYDTLLKLLERVL
jgi:ATP adenylyltransferase/5',5'''-P-1,P-4-tetraphosphate phosphorylase II